MLNVLITGAGGQLGRELQRLAALSPNCYVATDVAELDIADSGAVDRALHEGRFDVVVNCAAFTDVEGAEADPEGADRLNHIGAANLAAAAAQTGATLIHLSTDYVFDGSSVVPYTEQMPAAPLSVYGRTKWAGEEAVRTSGCKYLIFRTSWLYSEYGHNFLKTMLRLMVERDEVRVVCDQIGTPTYAGDLALALFSIIEGRLYAGQEGTYHFSNEGVASWYDFAVGIARAAGHDRCRIIPCRSDEYPARALRPACSVLDKSKARHTFGLDIPHWSESMLYCLGRLGALKKDESQL